MGNRRSPLVTFSSDRRGLTVAASCSMLAKCNGVSTALPDHGASLGNIANISPYGYATVMFQHRKTHKSIANNNLRLITLHTLSYRYFLTFENGLE